MLEQLGLSPPDDPVPTDEANLRGAGESIAIGDCMRALARAPGVLQGLRLSEWRDDLAAREAVDRAVEYMVRRRNAAEGRGFVARLPLGSVFLPLWIEAAERIGLDLRFVWTTRDAASVLRSLTRVCDCSPEIAQEIHALRSFYILRDAPAETLVLPYEGWARAPDAQVEALALLAGAADPGRREAAIPAHSGVLDHGAAEMADDPPAALRRLDDAIRGKRGQLGEILALDGADYARLMVGLADLIRDLHPEGRPFHARDAMEARLTLISRLAAESEKETPEMKDELEILAQRIRDVNHENRELTRRLNNSGENGSVRAASPGLAAPEPDQGAEGSGALRERTCAEEKGLAEVKAAYAELTRERDSLEEKVRARWTHEIMGFQRKEARYLKSVDRLRDRLDQARTQAAKMRVRLALRELEVKRLAGLRGVAALLGVGRSEERRRVATVAASEHFDADWYLKTYPDVRNAKMSPARHFVLHGVYEGRSPGPDLDTLEYYLNHPRALKAGINPVLHKMKRS
ncbi:hypothetical protein G5B40_09340 [Pikeienuella piscinae]|uniref:Uncharacterized protein n=1 Tax=Pikeienuella piscinae TaxID=2748098 RepID=A0A7L5BYP2_9RHOB|nr:hypothetical protein [Pikeienuella piscinae]QIE55637.1 hypothetical protein G5B40_09340 [Pikeienuella piscinae]